MLVIGIVGGVGSGKSSVTSELAALGAMALDVDQIGHDLLNETAKGDTNTQSGNAPVSLEQPFATGAPLPTDTTGMPAEVATAVTRDYSDLMKAINKKKGR